MLFLVINVSLEVSARIGKRRTLVIPKKIAERLGVEEGVRVNITVEGDKIIVKPMRDAVWLSLHGKKVARVSIEELEEESVAQQKRYIEG